MHRSSPPRNVPAFAKVGVDAAETLNTADFVNLERSTIRHADGFARGEYAILPEKAEYDRLRFSFGGIDLTDVDDATLALWALGSEGPPYLLGTSALAADGTFPAIECENHQATYFLYVQSLTEASEGDADLNLQCFVQGLFETVAVVG